MDTGQKYRQTDTCQSLMTNETCTEPTSVIHVDERHNVIGLLNDASVNVVSLNATAIENIKLTCISLRSSKVIDYGTNRQRI